MTRSYVDAYVIELKGSAKEHFAKRVRRTQRQHLRASYRAGVEVIEEPGRDEVDEYYDLHLRVRREREWTGPLYSRAFFRAIARTAGDGIRLIAIRHRGRIVGGGILLYDSYATHIFEATTDRAARGVYPHTVLYMTAIEQAETRGIRNVDLGGVNSGNDGLIEFKQAWGAEPLPVPVIDWRSDRRTVARNVLGFAGRSVDYWLGSRGVAALP